MKTLLGLVNVNQQHFCDINNPCALLTSLLCQSRFVITQIVSLYSFPDQILIYRGNYNHIATVVTFVYYTITNQAGVCREQKDSSGSDIFFPLVICIDWSTHFSHPTLSGNTLWCKWTGNHNSQRFQRNCFKSNLLNSMTALVTPDLTWNINFTG